MTSADSEAGPTVARIFVRRVAFGMRKTIARGASRGRQDGGRCYECDNLGGNNGEATVRPDVRPEDVVGVRRFGNRCVRSFRKSNARW